MSERFRSRDEALAWMQFVCAIESSAIPIKGGSSPASVAARADALLGHWRDRMAGVRETERNDDGR